MNKEDIRVKMPAVNGVAIMQFEDMDARQSAGGSLSLRSRWEQYEPMNCTPAELRVVESADDEFKLERPKHDQP